MYELLRVVFTWLFGTLRKAAVRGVENVPLTGGVIIAANHLSNWDPPFLATFVLRPVFYMAKEELFKVPLFGSVIRRLGAFPVRRGSGDRAAVKAAVAQLKDGRCVAVFPEGTRSKDGAVHRGGSGVALLAAMTGVPVVPAAIVGTNRLFSSRLAVAYGAPLVYDLPDKRRDSLDAFTSRLMGQIVALHDKESI